LPPASLPFDEVGDLFLEALEGNIVSCTEMWSPEIKLNRQAKIELYPLKHFFIKKNCV